MTEAITSYAGSLLIVGLIVCYVTGVPTPAQLKQYSQARYSSHCLDASTSSHEFFINLWHTNRFIFASAILVHGNLFRIRLQCHSRSVNSLCPR
jgi:hypothetical protein